MAKLQWGSETGSRRRELVGKVSDLTITGLQWGSETGSRRRRPGPSGWPRATGPRFNGAPRLGLGEGALVSPHRGPGGAASMGLRDWVSEKAEAFILMRASSKWLQWGSETGSRRRVMVQWINLTPVLLQWGSETGSRRRRRPKRSRRAPTARLQWGSETGSRRRERQHRHPRLSLHASMGLRDWVSEKADRAVERLPRRGASMGLRDWVSEKGWVGYIEITRAHRASMGLRDWVSEKAARSAPRTSGSSSLQWGSETGSRRRQR